MTNETRVRTSESCQRSGTSFVFEFFGATCCKEEVGHDWSGFFFEARDWCSLPSLWVEIDSGLPVALESVLTKRSSVRR